MSSYLMLFALAVSIAVPMTAALSSMHSVILSRTPVFSAGVTVTDVRGDSAVSIYIPYNLARAVVNAPPGVDCVGETRNFFAAAKGELASIRCTTGAANLDALRLVVNGTVVFEPVRFIVSVCPVNDSTRCWSNEESWRSPSAYDQLMSCQLVAAGVLIFWFVLAMFLCACVCRHSNFFTAKEKQMLHEILGEDSSSLLDSEAVAPYSDEGDVQSDGNTSDDTEKQRPKKRRR